MAKQPPIEKLVAKAAGPRRREFPAHLQSTPKKWRALKRQEWREVMAAFRQFQYGAAYVPAGPMLYKITRLLQEMEEEMNRKDWIAW